MILSPFKLAALCSLFYLLLGGSGFAAPGSEARSRNGMVVSADSLATAAGVEILRNGGNAVDAAVAVGFCLAVTYPEAGNIGGGGFMLIRLGSGEATMVDFREKAPAAATKDMFLDSTGNVIPGKSTVGPLSAGVPGTVAGLLLALSAYGTQGRDAVMRRAISLAEDGFAVDDRLARSLAMHLPAAAASMPATNPFFLDGKPLVKGATLRQDDLARALRAIRDKGSSGFYDGEVAGFIVAEMQKNGGIITERDLATYEALERDPVTGSYRGREVLSASPPSSGGIVLLQMLNVLELFDLRSKGLNSAATIHLIAAAAQRAYADRATYLGDPDFVELPTDDLLSKEYAAGRASTIDSACAGPSDNVRAGIVHDPDAHQTTHFCVADRFGNVVSVTYTLNDYYGGKTFVGGAGFFLNDEMDDFVTRPGTPNLYGLSGGAANAIAPGKRPLSTMAPTIVLHEGRPCVVLGARGGSRIATAVAQVILNVIDFGLEPPRAVGAPRIHHQWQPDEILFEHNGLPDSVIIQLRRLGYQVREDADPMGKVQAIIIDQSTGEYYGVADPREGGTASGY